MKPLIRALCVVVILYVTSYIVLRSLWTLRVQDNKKIEMQFPKSQGWLHGVFSPLCHLDASLSGMTFHIGPHPEDAEPAPARTTSPSPATTPAPTAK